MIKHYLLIALFSLSLHAVDFHTLFESPEHVMAGDEVMPKILLHLTNGLRLSFGDIVAMGDFYGTPESPISLGTTDKERKSLFLSAFNSFAGSKDSTEETIKIVSAIHSERKMVADELAKGRSAEEVYSESSTERVKNWNCITGGACSGPVWFLAPGRYLLLAKTDYDHFGDNAVKAYLTGHQVALEEAVKANKTQDKKKLEHAYAMDAFACHFLTDRFSSGHMRTPRTELPDHVTPSLVGSLLAIFMHNEDSAHGLHVHNAQGDRWVAYGDAYYLDSRNKDNLVMTRNALQASIGEVTEAFSTGKIPAVFKVLTLIPQVDESGSNANLDIAALFYFDTNSQELMRRSDLSDPYDHHWTSNWLGWSTLAQLKALQGDQ